MKPSLAPHLRDLQIGDPLTLETYEEASGEIREAVLRAPDGCWYPVTAGVPRLLCGPLRAGTRDFERRHGLPTVPYAAFTPRETLPNATRSTFFDKWHRFRNYGLDPEHAEFEPTPSWAGNSPGSARASRSSTPSTCWASRGDPRCPAPLLLQRPEMLLERGLRL